MLLFGCRLVDYSQQAFLFCAGIILKDLIYLALFKGFGAGGINAQGKSCNGPFRPISSLTPSLASKKSEPFMFIFSSCFKW